MSHQTDLAHFRTFNLSHSLSLFSIHCLICYEAADNFSEGRLLNCVSDDAYCHPRVQRCNARTTWIRLTLALAQFSEVVISCGRPSLMYGNALLSTLMIVQSAQKVLMGNGSLRSKVTDTSSSSGTLPRILFGWLIFALLMDS